MTSTSSVGRGVSLAGSVRRRPTTAPPTRTNSSREVARRAATGARSSRFLSTGTGEELLQLLLGELALAGAAAADGVDERESLVEVGIAARRQGCRLVDRLERLAAHRALGVWP